MNPNPHFFALSDGAGAPFAAFLSHKAQNIYPLGMEFHPSIGRIVSFNELVSSKFLARAVRLEAST
jgi:hypothetical protein